MKKETVDAVRLGIVWVAAIIAFLVGIALVIAGFAVPPTGVIDGTVLTALGELLTFFGSVFGIAEFTKVQMARIKNAARGEQDEE